MDLIKNKNITPIVEVKNLKLLIAVIGLVGIVISVILLAAVTTLIFKFFGPKIAEWNKIRAVKSALSSGKNKILEHKIAEGGIKSMLGIESLPMQLEISVYNNENENNREVNVPYCASAKKLMDEVISQHQISEANAGKVYKPFSLFGPSGTGKTSAIENMAQKMPGKVVLVKLNCTALNDTQSINKVSEFINKMAKSINNKNTTIIFYLDEIDKVLFNGQGKGVHSFSSRSFSETDEGIKSDAGQNLMAMMENEKWVENSQFDSSKANNQTTKTNKLLVFSGNNQNALFDADNKIKNFPDDRINVINRMFISRVNNFCFDQFKQSDFVELLQNTDSPMNKKIKADISHYLNRKLNKKSIKNIDTESIINNAAEKVRTDVLELLELNENKDLMKDFRDLYSKILDKEYQKIFKEFDEKFEIYNKTSDKNTKFCLNFVEASTASERQTGK